MDKTIPAVVLGAAAGALAGRLWCSPKQLGLTGVQNISEPVMMLIMIRCFFSDPSHPGHILYININMILSNVFFFNH